MSATKIRPRKTVQDFMLLPDGVRAELIDGEIIMSPSPRSRHQDIAFALARRLADFVDARGLGKISVAPLDVHLPSGDIVEPDVIFVGTAKRDIDQDWIRGVPDLLVEVISPAGVERDRIIKRALYARNGVREYWIVDDATQSVEILTLQGDQFTPAGYFEAGENVVSPLLTGLLLPVRDIFA